MEEQIYFEMFPAVEPIQPVAALYLLKDTDFGGILETMKEMMSIAPDLNSFISIHLDRTEYFRTSGYRSMGNDLLISVWREDDQLYLQLSVETRDAELYSESFQLEEIKMKV